MDSHGIEKNTDYNVGSSGSVSPDHFHPAQNDAYAHQTEAGKIEVSNFVVEYVGKPYRSWPVLCPGPSRL